eukprot:1541897-Amphidinium_carterae.1
MYASHRLREKCTPDEFIGNVFSISTATVPHLYNPVSWANLVLYRHGVPIINEAIVHLGTATEATCNPPK